MPRMADDKAAFTRVFGGLTGSPTDARACPTATGRGGRR